MNEKKRIFVIAGEPSGDQHAAEYIKKHTDINPNIISDAFGQNDIKKTNANLIYDTEKISVIGIIEVVLRYRQIYQALNIAKEYIKNEKPNLIVLVDYIEFNLKVAKYARNLGIPVLFYIAPQVWAWREKRAKKLYKKIKKKGYAYSMQMKQLRVS